jgi:DNA repair exonuclease SbcCD ATPase subunit
MKYKCPLCGSPLTESHFHRVIKLQEKKEKVQKGELAKLKKLAAAATAAAAVANVGEKRAG